MDLAEAQAAHTEAIREEQRWRAILKDADEKYNLALDAADAADEHYKTAKQALNRTATDLYHAVRADTAARKAAEPAGNEE